MAKPRIKGMKNRKMTSKSWTLLGLTQNNWLWGLKQDFR